MKITFVVPALNSTGGIRVVSIYAKLLEKKGHEVTVVSPNKNTPTFKQRLKSALNWNGYTFKPWFNSTFFENANYDVKVLDKHRAVECDDVPDADIIIATFWTTAEWIAEFPETKGKKVYFIQGYEVLPWAPIERVIATYQLPYKKIVVSEWVNNTLLAKHNVIDMTIVPNGVDSEQFKAPAREKNKHVKFGLLYSARVQKGCKIAFEAFERVKLINPNISLVAFGSGQPSDELPLPKGTKYYCLPEQDKLKDIYASCDAWILSSTLEGFGLPILEAMACRTPVISTKCGAAGMIINKTNGFLVDIDDSQAMFDAMCAVFSMSNDMWGKYSSSAYLTSTQYRWEDTANMFEKALRSI